jgi:hypothetical protein
MGLLAADMLS